MHENFMTEEKWKQFEQPFFLGVSNSVKDSSSKLNNHSAMAFGKFILALSVNLNFVLLYGCLPLDLV